MDLYRQELLDHYKYPRNKGHLEKFDSASEAANSTCGDHIRIELSFATVKGQKIVSDIRFSGIGCAISQASASMLTQKVLGKDLDYIRGLTYEDVKNMLQVELTPSRVKCAVLALEVIHKAIGNV